MSKYLKKCEGWFKTKHDFGRWEIESTFHVIRTDGNKIGDGILQKRICKNCHFVEYHKQEVYLNGKKVSSQ